MLLRYKFSPTPSTNESWQFDEAHREYVFDEDDQSVLTTENALAVTGRVDMANNLISERWTYSA